MKFLKVPKKQAEKIRQTLIADENLSKDYNIIKEGEFILLPILKASKKYKFEVVERDMPKVERSGFKLKDQLSEFLTDAELNELVTSFDLIGDIAIIEIPKSLEPKEKKIAEALLRVHRSIKTVLKKLGPMEGEYRIRKVKVIAGEKRTETIYKENDCRMKLDVSKVYFSVRLSTERKRIAGLVQSGERILALFAGVGPFPLVISKFHPDSEIVAIELNPDAVKYMEDNIKLNKIKNIKALEGDVREIVPKHYRDFADRVTMPLPRNGEEFLDVAFAGVKDGGIIHFYTMVSIDDPFGEALAKVKKYADPAGVSVEVISQRIVRPYAPMVVQVVLDLKVKK
ncbi:class I SAM-dependent methyltransferase family protein [Candidatus Micrarchaeota archaeon]|nr:class I SAM-dependent methyltransferase family protein [Candidatus Micrarchaeota archaeon]MBU1165377.1 class I SAM-dependent methyltransferase family protein [Candidatus Micrarchaeota archaeon]MBU1886224.1 class I SAM-dependent methyltransferase family protein [Candidatus Micrarchaeota archaeon]